jgi:hypothetical protein
VSSPPNIRVRCRQIDDTDIDAISNLLWKSGFGGSRDFWLSGLKQLKRHPSALGFPKYGYLLEVNYIPVGVLLLITVPTTEKGDEKIKCNVSSWFVWPAFRGYGSLLVKHALSRKDATYYNISPRPHTFELLRAQGYTRYSNGRFIFVPALRLDVWSARVERIQAIINIEFGLSPYEIRVLLDHAMYGCMSLVVTVGHDRYPFVFQIGIKNRIIRIATLIYCRDIANLSFLAGPLGRFLAKRGIFFIIMDANDKSRKLFGLYRPGSPKYYKGPDRPRLGDLAYSERVLLNIG